MIRERQLQRQESIFLWMDCSAHILLSLRLSASEIKDESERTEMENIKKMDVRAHHSNVELVMPPASFLLCLHIILHVI